MQGLPASQTASTFNAFIDRYPTSPSSTLHFWQFDLEQQDWKAAQSLIERYRKQFRGTISPPFARRLRWSFAVATSTLRSRFTIMPFSPFGPMS